MIEIYDSKLEYSSWENSTKISADCLKEISQVAQQYRADTARYRPMLMSIDEHR